MVEALRRCKAAFRVACITNNMKSGEGPGMARSPEKAQAVAEIMTLFEHVVESSKLGFRKPDPRIYRHACELLGVPPERCVYLDDLGINLKPARAMGMRTIKVGDPDVAIAELQAMVGIPLRAKRARYDDELAEPRIDELRRREEMARRMGGPDKIKRQHDGGKLTVRERIDRLLDTDSFHEIGAIAGKAEYDADGTAHRLHGLELRDGPRPHRRPHRSSVGGDDFTVRGGAADASIWEKQDDVRADGGRARHPDGAAGRRHRRRRLGEDLRDDRLHLRAAQSGVGARRRQSRAGCRWWRSAWARSPASARRAW